jgi:hypothetical protein
MNWRDFERAAPALAADARARFETTRIAMLGTIRTDGSPRLSPIEPYFTADDLLLGSMARSAKSRDLARDPRCALHSAISDPDAGEAEFKLYGTVREAADRTARRDAWWLSRPAGAARVFALDIVEATSISWALDRGEMNVTSWTAASGLKQTTRRYP